MIATNNRVRNFRRALWRFTGSPAATVVVIALLWFVWVKLAPDTTGNWPSGAPRLSAGQPDSPEATIVRIGGPRGVIGVRAPGTLERGDVQLGAMSYYYRARPVAGSGPVAYRLEDVMFYAVGMSQTDMDAARVAYIDYLAGHPNRYWRNVAATLKGGAAQGRSVDLASIFRVVGIIALLMTLVRTLAWSVPLIEAACRWLDTTTVSPAERAARKRKDRIKRGLCPTCKYSIVGLRVNRCPECASTWSESEAGLIGTGR